MLRAVLFDFYDTLAHVDSTVVLSARRAIAERAGADAEAMATLWHDTAHQRMLGTLGSLEEQLATLLGQLDRQVAPPLLLELAALDRDAWCQARTLYPEVRSTLATLKADGYRLGILSNCSCQAGYAIEQAGLDDVCDTLVLSYQLGLAKPQPEIYLHACASLGVAPQETMFVADGAFGELDAARAVGLVAVLIEQPRQSRLYGGSEQWDHRIESLAEVPELVRRLAGADERGST